MVLWMYEEYEYDKHARIFYYGAVAVLGVTFVYLLIFKPDSIPNAGWGVIGTIICLILGQAYSIAFKKRRKEVKT